MSLDIQSAAIAAETPEAANGVAPIERPSLHHVVVTRVRDMIIEGLLPAGTRIHEGQLGQQLGVSRTPLREALKVLASEGLVELVPSRGALVRELTAKDVQDMLAVLISLEEMAGPLACQQASGHEIAGVRALHDEMLTFYHAGNRLEYFKRNQQIHTQLITLTGNESLSMVHEMVQSRMRRVRYLGDKKEASWKEAVADHEEIIAALEARDGKRLAKAMTHHLQQTWERVRDAF